MTSEADIAALLDLADSASSLVLKETLLLSAQKASLRLSILDCKKCSLHETANAPVPWHGGPASVVIVGEAPGADEDRIGRPFVGRSGKLLQSALDEAGIEAAFVNTVCCRPPNNDFGLAVDADAPIQCRPWLRSQIDITGAWIIVPVGNQALWATMPEITSGITGYRGKYFWRGRHLYAPTFHPSYALRNRDAADALFFDLKRLAQVIKGEREVPIPFNYDPSALISSLRKPKLTATEATKFAAHFKSKGWVHTYSTFLEDHIICVRHPGIKHPPLPGVTYTVDELIKLSHMNRTWEQARRIHYAKRELDASIV